MRRAGLLVLVAALGLVPVGAARGDTALTTDPTAQAVAAYGGWVTWSRLGDDGRHHLVVRPPNGGPADATLPGSTRPVDAQVGLSPSGGVVATFTLCAPSCRVMQAELPAGTASTLPLGSRRCRASGVSSWKGAYAYVATGSGCRPGGVWYRPVNGRARLLAKSRNAVTTDLRGSQVLWAGEFYLRIQGARSRHARTLFVFFPGEGESYEVRSPSLGGDGFAYYALRHNLQPDFGQIFVREALNDPRHCQDLNRPRITRVGETRLIPVSLAADGDAIYYTNGAGVYQATDPPPAWIDRGC